MSLKPLIDRIAQHLATQRGRSVHQEILVMSDDGKETEAANFCQYRGDNGRMCAIGCLIPDEMYSPEIEGAAASDFFEGPEGGQLMNHFYSLAPEAPHNHVVTALEISQLFHDGLRSQKSLTDAVDYFIHGWCKDRERLSGSQLFDREVLTEDYEKLLGVHKETSDGDFAKEIARRLTYIVGVAIQWTDLDGKNEDVINVE